MSGALSLQVKDSVRFEDLGGSSHLDQRSKDKHTVVLPFSSPVIIKSTLPAAASGNASRSGSARKTGDHTTSLCRPLGTADSAGRPSDVVNESTSKGLGTATYAISRMVSIDRASTEDSFANRSVQPWRIVSLSNTMVWAAQSRPQCEAWSHSSGCRFFCQQPARQALKDHQLPRPKLRSNPVFASS